MLKRSPIRKKSSEQSRIDAALDKRKKWLIENEPGCIFCLQYVGRYGDLAHKIRRSYASRYFTRFELQTHKKNVGLSHRDCHNTFDSSPEEAKKLPGYSKILEDIKELDIDYYNKMI